MYCLSRISTDLYPPFLDPYVIFPYVFLTRPLLDTRGIDPRFLFRIDDDGIAGGGAVCGGLRCFDRRAERAYCGAAGGRLSLLSHTLRSTARAGRS